MGIIWSGWRVGAIAFPLAYQALLDQHGFQKTIYVLIAPMLSLLIPAVLLLRGRYHGATVSVTPPGHRVSKRQALRTPSVLYYIFATTLVFLVANVPKMFITTFAADIGLSRPDQALTLVCLTVSDVLGTHLTADAISESDIRLCQPDRLIPLSLCMVVPPPSSERATACDTLLLRG